MYTALILYALVALLFSFLCSLWESVLLSISPSYTRVQLDAGGPTGQRLAAFQANIDRPLAAILTLNTFANTIGAVGVGREASRIWADHHPMITSLGVPVAMTVAILLLAEILPKTIGANNWRIFAPFTVASLTVLIRLLAPAIWACQLITRAVNRDEKSVFTRSDFLAMAQIGSQEGHLDSTEAQVIRNLLDFKTVKARDIMTPRTVVVTAPEEMTLRDFYDQQEELVFSRVPICQGGEKDLVTGYVLKDHVLEEMVDGEEAKPLKALRREIIAIDENFGILNLFNDFLRKREQIAVVIDPFGGMAGIVTMEDVVETLLGTEIVDETDGDVDMQALARLRWKNRFKKAEVKKAIPHEGAAPPAR